MAAVVPKTGACVVQDARYIGEGGEVGSIYSLGPFLGPPRFVVCEANFYRIDM